MSALLDRVERLSTTAVADVADVVKRMRQHEHAYRHLRDHGRHRDASFEAESAEILAEWLRRRGRL